MPPFRDLVAGQPRLDNLIMVERQPVRRHRHGIHAVVEREIILRKFRIFSDFLLFQKGCRHLFALLVKPPPMGARDKPRNRRDDGKQACRQNAMPFHDGNAALRGVPRHQGDHGEEIADFVHPRFAEFDFQSDAFHLRTELLKRDKTAFRQTVAQPQGEPEIQFVAQRQRHVWRHGGEFVRAIACHTAVDELAERIQVVPLAGFMTVAA